MMIGKDWDFAGYFNLTIRILQGCKGFSCIPEETRLLNVLNVPAQAASCFDPTYQPKDSFEKRSKSGFQWYAKGGCLMENPLRGICCCLNEWSCVS